MIQHLLKWAVIAAFWRQVKPYLSGTLVALLGLLVIGTLHGEFVEYVRLSNDLAANEFSVAKEDGGLGVRTWLLISFVAKWSGFLGVALAWFLYFRRVLAQRTRRSGSTKDNPAAVVRDTQAVDVSVEKDPVILAKEDEAFDFLRTKRKLRGRGELILKGRDDSG